MTAIDLIQYVAAAVGLAWTTYAACDLADAVVRYLARK